MKTLIVRLAAVVTFLALTACAVSPQQVVIEPSTSAGFASAPEQGTRVGLTVEDLREEAVLGTLGGIYGDSSTLSASNDVAGDLRGLISDRLTEAGYEPGEEDGDLRLEVALTRLDYRYLDNNSLGSEVRVTAELRVRAERADGSYLERTFRSGSNQGRITRPTATDNRIFLQEALNDSLTRMVSDDQLNRFLGGG